MFFGTLEQPLSVKEAGQAKRICSACPVRRDCLISAFKNHETHGVWAGLTALERKRILKQAGGSWMLAIDTALKDHS